MTYDSYEIWFEEGDEYHVAHRSLDMEAPVAAARLNTALRNFAEDRASGLWLRGNGVEDIYLVPDSRWPRAAAMAVVNDAAREIRLIALVRVNGTLPMKALEARAERYLRI